MDVETLVATLAVLKKIPTTAISQALEAADAAEAAATLAQDYGYYLEFGDNETITVGSQEES